MHRHGTHWQDVRDRAAEQTHDDMHSGRGVIAMATHEEISQRAYDIYVKTGCKHGHCKQNWQQAEDELKAASH
jgi:hypothetical protein